MANRVVPFFRAEAYVWYEVERTHPAAVDATRWRVWLIEGTMNCDEARNLIERDVLEGLAPPERLVLEAHVDCCGACRAEAIQARSLAADLTRYAREPVPMEGYPALLRAARTEIRRARRRQGHGPVSGLLLKVAAVWLLACGLGFLVMKQRDGGTETAPLFKIVWRQDGVAPSPDGKHLYPLVRGDRVLAVQTRDKGHRLTAMDRETGDRLWETPFDVLNTFDADASHAYVWSTRPGGEIDLVAIDLADGRERWRRGRAPRGVSRVDWYLEVSEFGVSWMENGELFMASRETGSTLWSRALPWEANVVLPACGRKRIYVASPQSVSALDPRDGSTLWSRDLSVATLGLNPLAACDGAGRLYVAWRTTATHGMLLCYDTASGDLQWEHPTHEPFVAMGTAAGTVFLRGANVDAFDAATGSNLWSVAAEGCGPISLAHGRVHLISGQQHKHIVLLDADTGHRVMEQPFDGSCAGMVVDGTRVYISSHDGALYAVNL